MGEYVARFESLRLQLDDISESEAARRFVFGLKPHVKKALRREEARKGTTLSLSAVIALALVEDPSHSNRDHRAATPAPTQRTSDTMDLDAVDVNGRLKPLTDRQRNISVRTMAASRAVNWVTAKALPSALATSLQHQQIQLGKRSTPATKNQVIAVTAI